MTVLSNIGTKTISTKPINIKIIQQIESDYLATLFFEISPFQAARGHPFVIHLDVLKTNTRRGGTYEKLPQITVASSASPQDHPAVDIAPSDKQNLSVLGGTVYMCTFRLDTFYESLVPEIDFVNGREFRSYLSYSGAESDYSYFVVNPITTSTSSTVEANTPTIVKRDIAPDHKPFREDFLDASYGQPTLTQPRQLVVFVPPDYVGASATPPPTETATTTTAIPPDLPVGTRIISSSAPLKVVVQHTNKQLNAFETSNFDTSASDYYDNMGYPVITVVVPNNQIFEWNDVNFVRGRDVYLVRSGDMAYGYGIRDYQTMYPVNPNTLNKSSIVDMNRSNVVKYNFYYKLLSSESSDLDITYKFAETSNIFPVAQGAGISRDNIQVTFGGTFMTNEEAYESVKENEEKLARGNPLRGPSAAHLRRESTLLTLPHGSMPNSSIFKHGDGNYKIGVSITLGFNDNDNTPIYGKESEITFSSDIIPLRADNPSIDPSNPLAPAPTTTTTTTTPAPITRHVNRFTTSIDLVRVPFRDVQDLNTINENYQGGDGSSSIYGFLGHNKNQYKNG